MFSLFRLLILFLKFVDFGVVVCFLGILNLIEILLLFFDVLIFEYNYYILYIVLVVSVWYIFWIEFIIFDYLKNVDEKNNFNKCGGYFY